jgi:hypothetical protein
MAEQERITETRQYLGVSIELSTEQIGTSAWRSTARWSSPHPGMRLLQSRERDGLTKEEAADNAFSEAKARVAAGPPE